MLVISIVISKATPDDEDEALITVSDERGASMMIESNLYALGAQIEDILMSNMLIGK